MGVKGGWIAVAHTYPSEMAQNFWTAIWAWSVCFVVTVAVSLATRPKPDADLEGLVYALTPKVVTDRGPWWARPVPLGVAALAAALALNLVFR